MWLIGTGCNKAKGDVQHHPTCLLVLQVHVCLQTGPPGSATVSGFLQCSGYWPVLKERGDHELCDAIKSHGDGEVRHSSRWAVSMQAVPCNVLSMSLPSLSRALGLSCHSPRAPLFSWGTSWAPWFLTHHLTYRATTALQPAPLSSVLEHLVLLLSKWLWQWWARPGSVLPCFVPLGGAILCTSNTKPNLISSSLKGSTSTTCLFYTADPNLSIFHSFPSFPALP